MTDVVSAVRQILPLYFDHSFHVWSYQYSHRTLVLRGHYPKKEYDVDLVFVYVLGMKTISSYRTLLIEEIHDGEEIDGFVGISERRARKFLKLRLSDGVTDGFVVCGNLQVARRRRGEASSAEA